ncbi:hypothetical protein [Paraburkholderia sediminicola]|uniref:hypothetical protein n=1 Tax=Paraburkholderia sediminicola TaxID=458836 RepID=UPI0038BDE8BF
MSCLPMKRAVELTGPEKKTLQQLSLKHPHEDVRPRGLGVLERGCGRRVHEIAVELDVSDKSVTCLKFRPVRDPVSQLRDVIPTIRVVLVWHASGSREVSRHAIPDTLRIAVIAVHAPTPVYGFFVSFNVLASHCIEAAPGVPVNA